MSEVLRRQKQGITTKMEGIKKDKTNKRQEMLKITYLGGSHLQGVYNQGNNHQMPSYKYHKSRLGHPMSKKRQHAIWKFQKENIFSFLK